MAVVEGSPLFKADSATIGLATSAGASRAAAGSGWARSAPRRREGAISRTKLGAAPAGIGVWKINGPFRIPSYPKPRHLEGRGQ
jgi:hypothetical protein